MRQPTCPIPVVGEKIMIKVRDTIGAKWEEFTPKFIGDIHIVGIRHEMEREACFGLNSIAFQACKTPQAKIIEGLDYVQRGYVIHRLMENHPEVYRKIQCVLRESAFLNLPTGVYP